MLYAMIAVCVLVTADRLARARGARLYRAQVRWTAAMDPQAERRPIT